MSKVALVKGDNRYKNVLGSLNLIRKDINTGNKRIIIKPNLCTSGNPLAVTHVDVVRAILDFLGKRKFIIAEGAFSPTEKCFKEYGYEKLAEDYGAELIDLNKDDYEKLEISNNVKVRVSKLMLDPKNYIISAAVLKTHDNVVATLSLKNLVMGAIIKREVNDKAKMHQGVKEINYDIFRLSKRLKPDLSVIGGFKGMEGNGPNSGEPVESRLAIASTDFLAADRIGLEMMGIDASKVGYLNYCSDAGMGEYDIKKIKVQGNSINECRKKYRLHDTVEEQYKWH